MTSLNNLLEELSATTQTVREQGAIFESLTMAYLCHEPFYKDHYSQVWKYSDWAREQGMDGTDTGIDLVARTRGTNEYHAVQCKFYDKERTVQKKDIDSFFTASGKTSFVHRIIVATTDNWSQPAEAALRDQQPPVSKIDRHDLENSRIDWSQFEPDQMPALKPKLALREHQQTALTAVRAGLGEADRGKLIMACGTGKTFTSLKISEECFGRGHRVLFLVPSLALLSQSLTEWTQQSTLPLHCFAVCSDSHVGKKRRTNEDVVETFLHELRYPATTQAGPLARELASRHDEDHISVVFSTYHSIAVINEAQQQYGLDDFDLIICDEAHRTTGATFEGEEESKFVRVHDNAYIRASKRLYMTATPRLYSPKAQAVAEKDHITLCSMDDEALYGREWHVTTFSEAVERGLLVDYKVLVLAVDEAHISSRLQNLLSDENNQLKVDDAARIIGCWKALSKQDQEGMLVNDTHPMSRAVAFCQVIERVRGAKTHKVGSKNIAEMFQAVVEAYQEREPGPVTLTCEAAHIDGSMNASEKEKQLQWLKEEPERPGQTCRILSNVRCLSEGVDVPTLDAVLFLTPRNSQVDVVQSVGRIMRKAPNKKLGYVILPVVIPAGMDPSDALSRNAPYKVVWQVLQALRSHDDRFDAMINKLSFDGKDPDKMEVIAVTDQIHRKASPSRDRTDQARTQAVEQFTIGEKPPEPWGRRQVPIPFQVGEFERALYARIVQKCGTRDYWEDWAKDIANIAKTHIARITSIVNDTANVREVTTFRDFTKELRDDLNDSITDEEVIEMLAQHLITQPVFDALYGDYEFSRYNPISCAMQKVLDQLQTHHLEKETDTLRQFYASVRRKVENTKTVRGKQQIVVRLYDTFFRNAFPRMTERLGIVYTPVEVVDFIIHSVNDLLQSEFGQTLGSDNIHIIDPFTGTGTFITRLLQSGLINREQLPRKYAEEIHANEILLLAYYIAAINIEAVYHDIIGAKTYQPFNGICLTDTFQMYEKGDLISGLLEDNSTRRRKQKQLDIRVIMGNPPYSIGQKNQNDNNQNVGYPNLDERIRETYVAKSQAGLSKGVYDSYIRAIRWASDRIGDSGIIGFVTNAGFLEAATADGLRQCLAEEFSKLYVFHLRGNQRTSGELSRKEGGKIFGSGSRSPIAITLFVKNPAAEQQGQIYWHDIGDYLTQQEKLTRINKFSSVKGIEAAQDWWLITPDKHGDWVNQRDDAIHNYIGLGDKRSKGNTMFNNYSQGVLTSRDAWCYNASKGRVMNNITCMIDFYNDETARFSETHAGLNKAQKSARVNDFINSESTKIKWSANLIKELVNGNCLTFETQGLVPSLYRPFTKEWIYFNRKLNERVYQIPKILPNSSVQNLIICVSGVGARSGFSALMTNAVPNFHTLDTGQCFPLYLYEKVDIVDADSQEQMGLFADDSDQGEAGNSPYVRKDGISDAGLRHFQQAYPAESISKDDLFHYIYGMLHSPDYRERYANNLSKELPRIPRVKAAADFREFSKAGRALASFHLDYETVDRYPVKIEGNPVTDADYRVEKMKFGKTGKTTDKTRVIYNHKISMTGIPLEAYDYVVNGKSALEWVMERQVVTTHEDSGIVNDANDWAIETIGDVRYPLELFQRVITVSLETVRIVDGLPGLVLE